MKCQDKQLRILKESASSGRTLRQRVPYQGGSVECASTLCYPLLRTSLQHTVSDNSHTQNELLDPLVSLLYQIVVA